MGLVAHPYQDLEVYVDGWRVTLIRSHVALWARWWAAWLAWVAWALILGAHLHPRWDEILFAICLPCFVLLPYMIGTFILACIKLFLPVCCRLRRKPMRLSASRLQERKTERLASRQGIASRAQ